MDAVFELWNEYILKEWEGGIADRPLKDDPGGLTNKGVTIAVWREWAPKLFNIVGNEATLRQLTEAQAKRVAYEIYWKFYGIDKVTNPAIKLLLADSVWGGGGYSSLGYKSGSYAQRAAQINKDNQTNSNLFSVLVNRRLAYLRSLPNYQANKNGWENRVWKGDRQRLSLTQVVAKYKLNNATVGIGIITALTMFIVGRAVYKQLKESKK
ncbi:MAG: glycosyl hydrolase 108 family protein [Bacteroidota bacterium]